MLYYIFTIFSKYYTFSVVYYYFLNFIINLIIITIALHLNHHVFHIIALIDYLALQIFSKF